MDAEDLGDGWVDATGTRGGIGPTSDRLSMSGSAITLGGLLLRRAGLEHGDRVRIFVHTEKQRVRLRKVEEGETTGNKITNNGKYSGRVSCGAASRVAGVEEPQELEVLAVDDGDIVGGYK